MEVFRYLQIGHALKRALPEGAPLPESSPLESRLLTDYMAEKAISLTYRKIINNMPDPNVTLRGKWVVDLGDIPDEEWVEALASPRESAIRARFHLFGTQVTSVEPRRLG